MPLIKSKSDAAFKRNIRTLMRDVGKSPHVQSRKQAIAIAYSTKRRGKQAGGAVDEDMARARETLRWLAQHPKALAELQRNQMHRTELQAQDFEIMRGNMRPPSPAYRWLSRIQTEPPDSYGPPINVVGQRGDWVREPEEAMRKAEGGKVKTPDEQREQEELIAAAGALAEDSPVMRALRLPLGKPTKKKTDVVAKQGGGGIRSAQEVAAAEAARKIAEHDAEMLGLKRTPRPSATVIPLIRPKQGGGRTFEGPLQQRLNPIDRRLEPSDVPTLNDLATRDRTGGLQGLIDEQRAYRGLKTRQGGGKISSEFRLPWAARTAMYGLRPNRSKPLIGPTPGRADKRPENVASGSYVVPADVVAAIGQGNSLAGMNKIRKKFGKALGGEVSKRFSGTKMQTYGGGRFRMPGVPGLRRGKDFAAGGAPQDVPIAASDGEHVLSPDEVMAFGGGDMKRGHDRLDAWVLSERKKNIEQLKRLKPPKKD